MNQLADLGVDALCTYRLTRLVTSDEITAPLRLKVERAAMRAEVEDGVAAKIKTLVTCAWCSSFWIALVVPLIPRWARRVLALSAVAGILGSHYND